MWKIAIGFVVFAALALFILSRGGDIDLSGESHSTGTAPAQPEVAASTNAALASATAASSSLVKP